MRRLVAAIRGEITVTGTSEGSMKTDLLRVLRTLADALPPGASVTLDGVWLRAELEEAEAVDVNGDSADSRLADVTVERVAEELGRSGSTVRGWIAAAAFPNAFQLNRREWRIPSSDLRAFLDRQRPQASSLDESPRRRKSKGADELSSWRQHTRRGS
jgi:hypothetical protein